MKASGFLALMVGLVVFARSLVAEPAPKAEVPASDRIIDELIQQLDSNKFEDRQKASEMLRNLGKPVVAPLKKALENKPGLETATRIRSILRAIPDESKARKLREQLAEPVNLPEGIPANSTLKDALDFLSEKYHLTFVIDTNAFQAIEVQKVEEQNVTLPKMIGVRLNTVLRLLLGQLKGDRYSGTYRIRQDYIEVTTTKHTRPREWVGEYRDLAPRVSVEFSGESLDDALHELSERSGMNIVLDSRAAEQSWKPVNLVLNEAAVDTAVQLLADMLNLKVVALDEVLYVTSKTNARELEAEIKEREKKAPSRDKGSDKGGRSEEKE